MISGVAILLDGKVYSLPPPNRHHHVISMMVRSGCVSPVRGVQGFVMDNGEFIDRREAKRVASRNGQILWGRGNHEELFSEDLW